MKLEPSSSWKIKLLYDGDCPFCRREIDWMQRRNSNGKLAFENIAVTGFDASSYGLRQKEVMHFIHGVLPNGRIIKKLEVFQEAYRLACSTDTLASRKTTLQPCLSFICTVSHSPRNFFWAPKMQQ